MHILVSRPSVLVCRSRNCLPRPGIVPPASPDAAQVVARLRSAGFAGRRASAARNYAGAYLP